MPDHFPLQLPPHYVLGDLVYTVSDGDECHRVPCPGCRDPKKARITYGGVAYVCATCQGAGTRYSSIPAPKGPYRIAGVDIHLWIGPAGPCVGHETRRDAY